MDKTVTIFGSSKPLSGEVSYQTAYEIGRALAAGGWRICNGGYGGTMEAAAKGAKDAGGSTVGVTCTVFNRSGPNAYLDEVIETCDLFDRLMKLIKLGQAYVVLPGGSGTLVELALVWELIAKKLMEKRPIVLMGRFWEPVVETTAIERPRSREFIHYADTADDVARILNGSGNADR